MVCQLGSLDEQPPSLQSSELLSDRSTPHTLQSTNHRAPLPTPAGELGSLEEVVKEFIHKQFLRPVMLHEVGCGACTRASLQQAGRCGLG